MLPSAHRPLKKMWGSRTNDNEPFKRDSIINKMVVYDVEVKYFIGWNLNLNKNLRNFSFNFILSFFMTCSVNFSLWIIAIGQYNDGFLLGQSVCWKNVFEE